MKRSPRSNSLIQSALLLWRANEENFFEDVAWLIHPADYKELVGGYPENRPEVNFAPGLGGAQLLDRPMRREHDVPQGELWLIHITKTKAYKL